MPVTRQHLVIVASGLWRFIRRFAGVTVFSVVWLCRWWSRRPVSDDAALPRRVHAGRWLLANDHQCCGRPVVVRDPLGFRPGVELLYFDEENTGSYFGEHWLLNEDEAVQTAQAMHLKFLRGTRQRLPRQDRVPAVVTISAPHQDEAA
ncbi:hypothetical protein FP359_23215 [Klebsiella variicola]|uniref:hypothetical protein n=1 Tax=Klebsiella variicola TaxID=244366 RepID=UPI001C965A19|nr:hypothetical protein [Klebsiella variicola]MBY5172758.1 hypothetical protein [Klebsiella variicola]